MGIPKAKRVWWKIHNGSSQTALQLLPSDAEEECNYILRTGWMQEAHVLLWVYGLYKAIHNSHFLSDLACQETLMKSLVLLLISGLGFAILKGSPEKTCFMCALENAPSSLHWSSLNLCCDRDRKSLSLGRGAETRQSFIASKSLSLLPPPPPTHQLLVLEVLLRVKCSWCSTQWELWLGIHC